MAPLAPGASAPPIPGVTFSEPTAVAFYKVTCPVCQMAAPKIQTFDDAYPGHLVAVGEDPEPKLAAFATQYHMPASAISEPPPYDISEAYGVRTVPTMFLVDAAGTIVDTVEGWDRDGYNRMSAGLAEMTGATYAPVSEAGDGLPAFRPG
jgi:thiol-disulfide isomerase/thioredoxin